MVAYGDIGVMLNNGKTNLISIKQQEQTERDFIEQLKEADTIRLSTILYPVRKNWTRDIQ